MLKGGLILIWKLDMLLVLTLVVSQSVTIANCSVVGHYKLMTKTLP